MRVPIITTKAQFDAAYYMVVYCILFLPLENGSTGMVCKAILGRN